MKRLSQMITQAPHEPILAKKRPPGECDQVARGRLKKAFFLRESPLGQSRVVNSSSKSKGQNNAKEFTHFGQNLLI